MEISFRKLQRMTVRELSDSCPVTVTVGNLPAFKITRDLLDSLSEKSTKSIIATIPGTLGIIDNTVLEENLEKPKEFHFCEVKGKKCFNGAIGKFNVVVNDSVEGDVEWEGYLCQSHLDSAQKQGNVQEIKD